MGRPPNSKNKPKETTVADMHETVADEPTIKGEVAIFQPARLPYHPAIEDRFGVDKGQWKVLVEAIFPAAKSVDAIVMALTYCKSRNLDPFKRPVHIVPMWDSARGGYVETVWPGISELRTTASRTKGYAGCDEAEFGPEKTVEIEGRVKRNGNWETTKIKMVFPDWCRLTVYRMVDGQKCKFVGPKVKWLETYATQGASDLPNKMWEERPEGQLEKCAEAGALRRAFPEELGNELTAEEMIGRNVHDLSVDIPHTADIASTPHKDAGPPRAIAPPAEKESDPEQVRDGNPPPRQPKSSIDAAGSGSMLDHVGTPLQKDGFQKNDPISSGPPRTTAPKDDGPSDPGPQPHKIPGTGERFESWSEKYCDLLRTSADISVAYRWIDLNSDPLGRLAKGKPSVAATVKKATEQVMQKFRDAQEKAAEKAAKKAAPAGDMGEDFDLLTGAGSGPQTPSPADTNPETILKWAKEQLAAVENADNLESFYVDTVEPHIDSLFPPDREEVMAAYRAAERRLGGD